MKKNKICLLLCLLFIGSLSFAQVPRVVMSALIYEALIGSEVNINSIEALHFPNPYIDLPTTGVSASIILFNKKCLIINALDYDDGITPYSFNRSLFFKPLENVTRYDAVVAVMEAWDLGVDFTGNVDYNDIDDDNPYYPYINEAEDEGVLEGVFGSNFNGDNLITGSELVDLINNIINEPSHVISPSEATDPDNYFYPGINNAEILSGSKGIQQGVFNHYAKNSYSIPDRLLNLGFSHFYSTMMVEMAPGLYPIRPVGRGWSHTYNSYIYMNVIENPEIKDVDVELYNIVWPDGTLHLYYRADANHSLQGYFSYSVFDKLDFENGDDRIVITKKNQIEYTYERLDNDRQLWYLVKIEEPNGNDIDIDYESANENDTRRIDYVESPSGKRLNFYYHSGTDLLRRVRDPISRNIYFEYQNETPAFIHEYPILEEFDDAKGQTTTYSYGSKRGYESHIMEEISLPRGNKITADYDGEYKLSDYQYNNDEPIEVDVDIDYDRIEVMITDIDVPMPDGGTQRYNYNFDSKSRLVDFSNSHDDLDISYSNSGSLLMLPSSSTVNGIDADVTYDSDGNPTHIKYTAGTSKIEHFFDYDSDNNITEYTDPEGNTTKFYYDNDENLTTIVDAYDNTITFTYDTYGQLTSSTNQEGIKVTRSYESDGALSSVNAPMEISASFSYDGINRLLQQNLNGLSTQFEYDNNDNLTRITNALGYITNYSYDANDNLSVLTNAKGVATSFTYNNEDKPLTFQFDNLVTSYDYNDDGTLDDITKPSGQKLDIDYNSDGLPDKVGTVSDITYTNEGHPNKVTNANGTIDFDYDNFYRVDEITTIHGYDVEYDYKKTGALEEVEYPTIAGIWLSVEYEYDAKNRVDDIKISSNFWSGQRTLAHYEFKGDDRVSSIDLYNGTSSLHSYDSAGRNQRIYITKSDNTVIFDGQYTYDVHNNITQEQVSYIDIGFPPTVPNIETTNTQNYSYNNTNHIQTGNGETFSVNNDGNTTNLGNGIITTYTLEDRLASFTKTGESATFKYNPYGQRVEASRNGVVTKYVRDVLNDNILIELDGNNNPLYYYIWHPNGMLIARLKSNGDLHYYHGDIRGSTIAISDANENITHQYKYKPFGEIAEFIEPASETNNFKYVGTYGVEYENNDLYYMRARYYQPSTGRFLTQDPIWHDNLYVYASNNPVGRVDPIGREDYPQDKAIAILEKVVGVYHVGADLLGLVPGLGEIADGYNAVLYTIEKDYLNAGLSAAATIPFIGWGATFAKHRKKIDLVLEASTPLNKTKHAFQRKIKGNFDTLYNDLIEGAKHVRDDLYLLDDGTYINKHKGNTIDIKRDGVQYKLRVE